MAILVGQSIRDHYIWGYPIFRQTTYGMKPTVYGNTTSINQEHDSGATDRWSFSML